MRSLKNSPLLRRLEEWGAAQIEHKLREEREFLRQLKGGGVVLVVGREFRDETDQNPVHSAQHICLHHGFHLKHAQPGHKDRASLLVEARPDIRQLRVGEPSRGINFSIEAEQI